MADKKLSELTELTNPGDTDVLPIVDNSGTPTTKKVTIANLKTEFATDISGKVDVAAGYSLVADTEIAKIHEPGSDDQDLSGLVEKVTGYSLVADTEIAKIHEAGSDNQVIPEDLSDLTDTTGIIPTDTGDLTNGAGFITSGDIPTIPANLDDLTDVTLSSVTNGDHLVYDTDHWANVAVTAGGGQVIYDAIVAPSDGDYTTIQAALNAGKKRIYVKDGTYTLDANLTIQNNDTWIVGQSWDTVIALGSDYQINFAGAGYSGFRLENIKVTATATGGWAMMFNASIDCWIRRCCFDVILGIASSGDCRSINITESLFIDSSGGAKQPIALTSGSGHKITDNVFRDICKSLDREVIVVTLSNGIVSNNYFYNVGNSNITSSLSVISVTTGDIVGNLIDTVDIQNGNNIVYGIKAATYSTVSSNTLRTLGRTSGRVMAIYVDATSTVTGNHIQDVGNSSNLNTRGIAVAGAECSVTGNVIKNVYAGTEADGIYNWGGYSVISGNYINGLQNATTKYAIRSDSDYNIITGNFLSTNQAYTAVIYLGAGTQENSQVYNNHGAEITCERKLVRMTNTSGGAINAGDVVVFKASASGKEITTTTTAGDDKVLGMAVNSIDNNATGLVLVAGKTTQLKVNGTTDIAIGDLLGTFTSAGIAQKAGAGDMAFAIALEAYTADDSSGVIDALLISPRLI